MGILKNVDLAGSTNLITTEWGIDQDYNRRATRSYLVATTTDCDDVYVGNNIGIIPNTPHPTDTGNVVVDIDVKLLKDEQSIYVDPEGLTGYTSTECYFWVVTLTFGPWDPLEHSATGDPTLQPVSFSFDWQTFEQIADTAIDPDSGDLVPVLNSSGFPFDPPVTRESLKGIMRIAWNSLTFDPYPFFAYGNQLNNDTWNGFPPFTLKVSPPKMPQRLYSQYLQKNYYRLEMEICFNPNETYGWLEAIIDRGTVTYNSTTGKYERILDSKGNPYPDPTLLDGSGGILDDPANYVVLPFQTYYAMSFNNAFSANPNLNNLFYP